MKNKKMKRLPLPSANDINGNLVHIESAQKGEKYTCPICGAEVVFRKSRKNVGEKYYRINHFAHKGDSDNHCSESFLHKYFKSKCAEYIREKMSAKAELFFEWECKKCDENHRGNLLKKAVRVEEEYDLEVCKPDIALLDDAGKVIIVIEVVVSHKPEPVVLQYYEENKIACLQIKVEEFKDCEKIEHKLSCPTEVNLCVNPSCPNCGKAMYRAKLVTVVTKCYKCSNDIRIAMKVAANNVQSPMYFSEKEVAIARSLGAKIEWRYSQTRKDNYFANVCGYCNAIIGDFYMHEYYHLPHEKEVNLGNVCFRCAEEKVRMKQEVEDEAIRKQQEIIEELSAENISKYCPKCGKKLKIRKSNRGIFWGCGGYPRCKHTEDIKEEELNL